MVYDTEEFRAENAAAADEMTEDLERLFDESAGERDDCHDYFVDEVQWFLKEPACMRRRPLFMAWVADQIRCNAEGWDTREDAQHTNAVIYAGLQLLWERVFA